MAPPPEAPLLQRLMALAQTLQFGWFIGHFTLLLTTFRYALAAVKFSTNTRVAGVCYRLGFLSAAVTYGIVVYKAYRPRVRNGQLPGGQAGVMKVLADENVQYLFMALIWLYSKPIFYALLPFAVYSTFHFLTYLRTNLLPAILPPPPPPPLPLLPHRSIAKFVKNNYDYSMHLVANLELFLWARIFGGAIIFRNSWILLAIYTIFLRVRYSQSVFVRDALKGIEVRGNALAADNNVPDGVKAAWSTIKSSVKSFGELTDLGRYLGGGGGTAKKAQ
ncbi:hypothetical protein L873DRAFT_1838457 [Choiromyces venosus 120613-1]|uniref:Endoplasmic reticulum protein n=1 Tax=Choiromyces venosus 120613-1 TaxID=1336337 RepID=A0A3N4J1G3_9PEZI|nr:hypothetical protein L873DRAFT_1838457 [Choiromyces venosus 120613-1]